LHRPLLRAHDISAGYEDMLAGRNIRGVIRFLSEMITGIN
jgi:hypothetical protein